MTRPKGGSTMVPFTHASKQARMQVQATCNRFLVVNNIDEETNCSCIQRPENGTLMNYGSTGRRNRQFIGLKMHVNSEWLHEHRQLYLEMSSRIQSPSTWNNERKWFEKSLKSRQKDKYWEWKVNLASSLARWIRIPRCGQCWWCCCCCCRHVCNASTNYSHSRQFCKHPVPGSDWLCLSTCASDCLHLRTRRMWPMVHRNSFIDIKVAALSMNGSKCISTWSLCAQMTKYRSQAMHAKTTKWILEGVVGWLFGM